MKFCSMCGTTKPKSEFYTRKGSRDGLQVWCKECGRKRRKEYYHEHFEETKGKYTKTKEFIDSLKTPCAKCGETRLYLIQFHHKDPDSKKFNIGGVAWQTHANIAKEVEKCVCLCSNCHDEFHWFYGKTPRAPITAIDDYLKGELK